MSEYRILKSINFESVSEEQACLPEIKKAIARYGVEHVMTEEDVNNINNDGWLDWLVVKEFVEKKKEKAYLAGIRRVTNPNSNKPVEDKFYLGLKEEGDLIVLVAVNEEGEKLDRGNILDISMLTGKVSSRDGISEEINIKLKGR